MLFRSALSDGGKKIGETLFKAYDVKGEKGWIIGENWDKVTKMADILQDEILKKPELVSILFGDQLLKPEEMINELQMKAVRAGSYFGYEGDIIAFFGYGITSYLLYSLKDELEKDGTKTDLPESKTKKKVLTEGEQEKNKVIDILQIGRAHV